MRSPLSTGIIYLILGVIFTFFAVQQVNLNGWNFLTYTMILLATIDFGAAFRFLSLHFKKKKD